MVTLERKVISREEKGWPVRPGTDAGPGKKGLCGRLRPRLTLLPTGFKHRKCLISSDHHTRALWKQALNFLP